MIRSTLGAETCDLVRGVPASYELALTTRPYYRSSYVFLWRPDRFEPIASLDDERLRRLRIGLHLIGDDYSNVPPAEALAKRGIIQDIRGYSIYGDYSRLNPPAELIAATARGDVDVAIAWGPVAGYFAARERTPLQLAAVHPQRDGPLTFAFDISVGVRLGDAEFRDRLNRLIEHRGGDIRRLLERYRVPVVEPDATMTKAGES